MKEFAYLIFGFIILISNVSAQDKRYINVTPITQEQYWWCWAACSQMIINHYGNDVDQCDVAEYARTQNTEKYGDADCCTPSCNAGNLLYGQAGCIMDILNYGWDISASWTDNTPSFATTKEYLKDGAPIIVGWQTDPPSDLGHVVLCDGYDNKDPQDPQVKYIDPAYGSINWCPFNALLEPDWFRTWTETIFLAVPPACSLGTSEYTSPLNYISLSTLDATIKVSSIIDNSSNISFEFQNELTLEYGFEIRQGSSLEIEYNNGCE